MSAKLGSTVIQNWSRKYLTNIESDCVINFPQTSSSILIEVFSGKIQAFVSNLISATTPITAGMATAYDIQSKDVFGNLVISQTRDDLFFIDVLHPNGSRSIVNAQYHFEVYQAILNFTNKGTYSCLVGLTTNGGL